MLNNTLNVVGATRNEARNVALVISELAMARDLIEALGYRMVLTVVDDASTDDTVGALRRESALRNLEIDVVDGPCAGLSQAIAVGLRRALSSKADAIGIIDFDGQHDATEIPRLVERLGSDPQVDCVFGSRFLQRSTFVGVGPVRRLLSHSARLTLRGATRMHLPSDPTTSFRVSLPDIITSFLDEVPIDDLGGYEFFFWFAIYCAARGTFADVPIRFRPRLTGASKLKSREVAAAFMTVREVGSRAREWRRKRAPGPGFPDYPTEYLDNLGALDTYNSWLVGTFAPHIRGAVLEIGAGTGTVTGRLCALDRVSSVVAVEPDAERNAALTKFVADAGYSARVTPVLGTSADIAGEFDTVLYCNSAEHIEDLRAELRVAHRLCAAGGTLVVFGPAHELLYGELDRLSGHWRRFTSSGVARDLRDAGFGNVRAHYLDPVGTFAYLVGGRIGGASSLSPRLLRIFEKVVLPLSVTVTPLTRKAFGKNVLAIGMKSK